MKTPICSCLFLIDDKHSPDCPVEVDKDLKAYLKGMMSNNNYACVAVEKKYHLYGASPEVVITELREYINFNQPEQDAPQ